MQPRSIVSTTKGSAGPVLTNVDHNQPARRPRRLSLDERDGCAASVTFKKLASLRLTASTRRDGKSLDHRHDFVNGDATVLLAATGSGFRPRTTTDLPVDDGLNTTPTFAAVFSEQCGESLREQRHHDSRRSDESSTNQDAMEIVRESTIRRCHWADHAQ